MDCPHCKGTGKMELPSDLEKIEAYYFGCWGDTGYYWMAPDRYMRTKDIVERVGPGVHPRIDGGFCPGSSRAYGRKSRAEAEGEAALHHIDGWTVLALWDRSVDDRHGSNSNFVARGTHDYATMRAIAEARFPDVWCRFTFEIKLVESVEG